MVPMEANLQYKLPCKCYQLTPKPSTEIRKLTIIWIPKKRRAKRFMQEKKKKLIFKMFRSLTPIWKKKLDKKTQSGQHMIKRTKNSKKR